MEAILKIAHDLESAFIWEDTEQGYEYWQTVVDNLKQVAKEAL